MTTGQTTSPDDATNSDNRFSRTVMDIQDRMTSAIRTATSSFIGRPVSEQSTAQMTAEVQASLDVMADAGVISNSTLESVVMRGDTIDLNYTVQPTSSIVTIHPPAEVSAYDAIRANAVQQIQEAEDEQILTQMELAVTAAERRMARAREGLLGYRAPVSGLIRTTYDSATSGVNYDYPRYEHITDIVDVDPYDELIKFRTPFTRGFRAGRTQHTSVSFEAWEEIGMSTFNVNAIRRLELYSEPRRSGVASWQPYRAPANSLATAVPTMGWTARSGELAADLTMMGHITAEQAAAFADERLGRPYPTRTFEASYVTTPADRSGRDTTPKLPKPEPKPKLSRWDILLMPKGE